MFQDVEEDYSVIEGILISEEVEGGNALYVLEAQVAGNFCLFLAYIDTINLIVALLL
jgi:hypothetical protein